MPKLQENQQFERYRINFPGVHSFTDLKTSARAGGAANNQPIPVTMIASQILFICQVRRIFAPESDMPAAPER